jgi:alpha,alpha-trehalase
MSSIRKAKKIVSKALPKKKVGDVTAADVTAARAYIADFWQHLERKHTVDDESLIGLPNSYLVPAHEEGHSFDFNELYYWDSYFMVQGMLDKEHQELVTGILENLMFMFERFKVIPNASRTYLMGRSQPPFLTTFIRDIYDTYNPGNEWLKKAMDIAAQEYETVWMGTRKPNERLAYKGLSRYYDVNYLHDLAEAESGWDMTPRFGRKALNFLPVDLNSLLYKYESDLAWASHKLGNEAAADNWGLAAETRQKTMNKLMWDKQRGLYYDYNYVRERRGPVSSLASYFPLWAGIASPEQAAALVKSLRRFENKGGLATTDVLPVGQFVIGSMPTQWAYPNGWAPLQYITIRGLERYGYHEDARRIAMKWLKSNLDWFNANNVFLEKYNVVNPDKPPIKGVYPSQTGFGWTNAVFERLCQDYIDVKD